MRFISTALVALLLCSSAARADDFGPIKDARAVDAAAKRLVAHRIRPTDLSAVTISDTVVVRDQALLTWRAGSQEALMGLVRYADRWWDALDEVDTEVRSFDPLVPSCIAVTSAFPLKGRDYLGGGLSPVNPTDVGMTSAVMEAARNHNAFAKALAPPAAPVRGVGNLIQPRCAGDMVYTGGVPFVFSSSGGLARQMRDLTAGYDVTFRYSASDARAGTQMTSLRARAPSLGEFLPASAPAPGDGYGTSVVFLYFDTNAKAPIAFQKGGSLDIWVPWPLNDSLRYDLGFDNGSTHAGPIKATLYDNVLHFDLPAFSLPPGETVGEVDGYF